VVFVGDQNTYVNDLLEDITIVICKYGMKYNTQLVASAAEYKLLHTETVHNYAFLVHVISLAKHICLTLRSHDAVIRFYYFTEVRSLQKHIAFSNST
jgi:hypothetical protein